MDFTNCNFGGSYGVLGATQVLRVTGGSCANGAGVSMASAYFTGVRSTGLFGLVGTSGSVTARNCLIVPANINGGFSAQAVGTLDYQGCTVDCTATTSNNSQVPLFSRTGALTMTWRNNVLVGSSSITFPVLDAATSADTLAFDHNVYSPDTGLVVSGYNDGTTTASRTLAQWRALGQDAGSVLADPLLAADDSLQAGSPAIDLGVDLAATAGVRTDFTGAVCAVRNDAGAFEYPLPALRRTPVGGTFTEGAGDTLAVTVAGNGPFTYQWRHAGQAIPGATGASLVFGHLLPGDSGQYVLLDHQRGRHRGQRAGDVGGQRAEFFAMAGRVFHGGGIEHPGHRRFRGRPGRRTAWATGSNTPSA